MTVSFKSSHYFVRDKDDGIFYHITVMSRVKKDINKKTYDEKSVRFSRNMISIINLM